MLDVEARIVARADETRRLDPVFKFAYENLPNLIQEGIQKGNPRAIKRLYAEYERLRSGAPNRAERRRRL